MIALDNEYLLRFSVKMRDVAINAHVGHHDTKRAEVVEASDDWRPTLWRATCEAVRDWPGCLFS